MDYTMQFFSNINAAIKGKRFTTVVRFSREVYDILRIFRREGLISSFTVHKLNSFKQIFIVLNYVNTRPVIKQIIAVSRPGRRVYTSIFGLRFALSKLNTTATYKLNQWAHAPVFYILSTDIGVITQHDAFRLMKGGRLLCSVEV